MRGPVHGGRGAVVPARAGHVVPAVVLPHARALFFRRVGGANFTVCTHILDAAYRNAGIRAVKSPPHTPAADFGRCDPVRTDEAARNLYRFGKLALHGVRSDAMATFDPERWLKRRLVGNATSSPTASNGEWCEKRAGPHRLGGRLGAALVHPRSLGLRLD